MGQKPFVGRHSELARLREVGSAAGAPRITAIYGRRRIGKTRLVEEAFGTASMLRFEGLEGQSSARQRKHYLKTLHRASNLHAHRIASPADWEDLLLLTADYVQAEPTVLFLDELQWMAAGRSDLVSKLKYVWDNHFARGPGVHLILCGSISSFLVDRVIRSKALFGRIDRVMELGPLSFGDVRAGFLARRGVREALEAYLVVGGVPKYLELIDPSVSVRLNLLRLGFTSGAYLVDEFDRIFVSHFGSQRYHRRIVEHLAARKFATRSELIRAAGLKSGGRITRFLEDLVLAGFVESYGSIHNPSSTHLRRYRIADPYLRFYFSFIRPQLERIRRAPEGLALHQALPDKRYEVFLGLAFEHFCHQHAARIAERLGFSAVAYDCGAWFTRGDQATGAQVDLLFKRADRVLTLCEVKFRQRVGREVIEDVERKVQALSAFRGHTVERVLISALPPSAEVAAEGYFSKILTAEDLV